MKTELPQEKKLIVEYRVEGGCLGPTGDNYVDGFCDFARIELASWEADLINWVFVPRKDKSIAELQYKIEEKNLSREQAKRFLQSFGKSIDELEAEIDETLFVLIDEYMSKQ